MAYDKEILERFEKAKFRGRLEKADFASEGLNPACGDSISFQGCIENGCITKLAFDGKGCVISQVSADLLSGHCIGKTIEQVEQVNKDTVLSLLCIQLGPTRMRCALLPLQALQNGVAEYKKKN